MNSGFIIEYCASISVVVDSQRGQNRARQNQPGLLLTVNKVAVRMLDELAVRLTSQ